MSLQPHAPALVPEDTARIARAAFPKGNVLMKMRDEAGAIYEDESFAHLFSMRGKPAQAPWRLALVTIFQFAEGLSDRQAADAVRGRIDWKYALSLELEDSGFDHTVLSEFRARLLEGGSGQLLLDTLLVRFRELGLLKARGRQRTDSTHVLAKVRALNRLDLVRETMRHALDVLAAVAPDWMREHSDANWANWVQRYAPRSLHDRLPTKKEERDALAQSYGPDGYSLLDAVCSADSPAWLREVPAVDTLRVVWLQNYYRTDEGVYWRSNDDIPPSALFVNSPHDLDARMGRKYTSSWTGYKVHLTETCEDDSPPLITHVETTSAPKADGEVTPKVHEALKARGLLPGTHLVDTGFLDAELIVTSKAEYSVDLLGPARPDVKWQAKQGEGFDAASFMVDWEKQEATCPVGRKSISWTPAIDNRSNHVIKIKFSTKDCKACLSRDLCVRSGKKYPRRTVTVREYAQYEALQHRREREKTTEYAREYARRAGIEGTISRGVRSCGLRRSRYAGLARTHLGHVLTAAGINFSRVGEWLAGTPRAKTRNSRFAALMAPPACC